MRLIIASRPSRNETARRPQRKTAIRTARNAREKKSNERTFPAGQRGWANRATEDYPRRTNPSDIRMRALYLCPAHRLQGGIGAVAAAPLETTAQHPVQGHKYPTQAATLSSNRGLPLKKPPNGQRESKRARRRKIGRLFEARAPYGSGIR